MYGTTTEELLRSKYVENQIFEHVTVMLEKGSHEESFGIAISGGCDAQNDEDPLIVISDVLPNSPADSLVKVGDVIIAINGENVENVTHDYAVGLLRSMRKCVYLLVKRTRNTQRKTTLTALPTMEKRFREREPQIKQKPQLPISRPTADFNDIDVTLRRGENGFGLYLGNLIFVKDKIPGTPAADCDIRVGDIVLTINDVAVDSCKSTDDVLHLIKKTPNLKLKILRPHNTWVPEPLTSKSQRVTKADWNLDINDPYTNNNRFSARRNSKQPTFNSMRDLRSYSEDTQRASHRNMNYQKRNNKSPIKVENENPFDQYSSRRRQQFDCDPICHSDGSTKISPQLYTRDSRCVKINNRGSQLGIQLLGGNKYGIFISSMMDNSPAAMSGLRVGDQIVSVNGVEFMDITREDAVMYLLSLKNEPINLVCVNKIPTFEKIRFQQCDEFYIRVNFDYIKPSNPKELILRKGELLLVRDTMHGGVVGSWSAVKISINNELGQSGIIPNKTRAEQTAIKSKLEEKKNNDMKRRLRPGKISSIRTKAEYQSQDKLDTISFKEEMVHIPAYQIVLKKPANFKRPVILIGVASDIYRDFLKIRLPNDFDIPMKEDYSDSYNRNPSSVIKLYQIKKIINDGKHCLLDVSYQAVEMLHQANLSPIVIHLKMSDKKLSTQFRIAAINMVYGANRDQKSRKEVRDINRYGLKFHKRYPLYITATLEIFDQPVDQVYVELLNIIRSRQSDEIFISAENIDPTIIESYALNEPDYRSGYSSAAESGTDEDTDSYFAEKSKDDKVFKNNQNENQKIEPIRELKSQDFNQKSNGGRNINIEYQDGYKNLNEISNRGMNEKDQFENQRLSSRMANQKSNSSSIEMVELSLNTVLKIPFDAKGGLTESVSTNVSVYVPPGAMQGSAKDEIFVKIYLPKGSSSSQIINSNENEIVVVCGPEGFKFTRPIEIRIPFKERPNETIDSQIFITPDLPSNSSKWKQFTLNYPGANGNTFNLPNNIVAILVDRF